MMMIMKMKKETGKWGKRIMASVSLPRVFLIPVH